MGEVNFVMWHLLSKDEAGLVDNVCDFSMHGGKGLGTLLPVFLGYCFPM